MPNDHMVLQDRKSHSLRRGCSQLVRLQCDVAVWQADHLEVLVVPQLFNLASLKLFPAWLACWFCDVLPVPSINLFCR